MVQVGMLSDECLSRYGLLENFNASVTRTRTGTRTGTGTWTTGVTAIALCTSCSRAKNCFSEHRTTVIFQFMMFYGLNSIYQGGGQDTPAGVSPQ